MRVMGVGEEYSDLLEAAGVDTVRELVLHHPENLHQAINGGECQEETGSTPSHTLPGTSLGEPGEGHPTCGFVLSHRSQKEKTRC